MINPVESEMIHVKHLYYMENISSINVSYDNEDYNDYGNDDTEDYKCLL